METAYVTFSCHFNPFGVTQGKLREKSLFRPKGEIFLKIPHILSGMTKWVVTQSLKGDDGLKFAVTKTCIHLFINPFPCSHTAVFQRVISF
jgi:hypothetical protein